MITITCSCGHNDDLTAFTSTPLAGDLPPGCFQCPSCGTAWRRRETDHRVLVAGEESIIIPGRVVVETVQAWM